MKSNSDKCLGREDAANYPDGMKVACCHVVKVVRPPYSFIVAKRFSFNNSSSSPHSTIIIIIIIITMSTFTSATSIDSYNHDDQIFGAGYHHLDLDFLSQRLQERSPRKSRLISYFDGFMEFAKQPPSLSPSPMTSRCSSPSRESVSHSSESDHSNATERVMDVKRTEKAQKTKGSKGRSSQPPTFEDIC
jgi:hypothetical protein